MKLLIDGFIATIDAVAAEPHGGVKLIRIETRRLIDGAWKDEIHPSKKGGDGLRDRSAERGNSEVGKTPPNKAAQPDGWRRRLAAEPFADIAILKTQLQRPGCDGACAFKEPRGFSIEGCVVILSVRGIARGRATRLLTENQEHVTIGGRSNSTEGDKSIENIFDEPRFCG